MRVIVAIVLIVLSLAIANPAGADVPCSPAKKDAGLCVGGGTDGSTVDISGTEEKPITGTVPGGSGGEVAPGSSSPSTDGSGIGGNPREIVDALDPCPVPGDCTPIVDGEPAVTLRDIAAFTPSAPSITMEPNGWMLRGLPANFVAAAPESTVEGVLLERPVTVRFVPVTFTWTWGDGTIDTVTEPGRTWERLGVPRFSKTATSHTYADRGTVTVSLSVAYAASYRFDGGDWRTVDGSVAATTRLDASVRTARTVLVPGDCTERPEADGC